MKQVIKQYAVITAGIIILAFSLHFFLIPNDIAAGGVMGIAMIINKIFPIVDVGAMMLILNIVLFIVAFATLGRGFGVKTIYASIGLSGIIWALERLLPMNSPLTDDLLLAAIIGTIISGLGMAVIFNRNASTGGTDIIAKILNKFFHIDIGKSLLITDFLVTVFATLAFGIEKGLYAVIAILMNGFIIDYAIAGFNIAMQVFVMSSKWDVVAEYIMNDIERGVTYFKARGAYSGDDMRVVYTVLNRGEFIKLRNYIREVDPKAFITVSDIHEVLGEGFKRIDSE
jgi:uncharacterized membrane-anchored protein YitT (DUF2179 family)